ncbi:hypothetical protein R1sor_017227 [Riccia sorocarpa]|uniref:VWFA domain-containing protein n=1 Tax=Riccia sorocarpa TaxID=122646 RepID=A0ABD3I9T7_9MARC
MCVDGCKLIEKGESGGWIGWMWRSTPAGDDSEVALSFTQQEKEAERITWKAFEIAPFTTDKEKLLNDPQYVLTPACSEGKALIDLNPATQNLMRVYFLQGGQVLIFVEESEGGERQCSIYLSPKLGSDLSTAIPIMKLRRRFDLVCFDEKTRFIALYHSDISSIKVYRLDDTFRHMDWTGSDIRLSEYFLRWMDFVKGKNEVVFIDDQSRVRICEVSQSALVRPGNTHLGSNPILKALVSAQCSCLLVLRSVPKLSAELDVTDMHESEENVEENVDVTMESATVTGKNRCSKQQELVIDVYKLDDTIVHVRSLDLEMLENDVNASQITLVSFETQQHLVVQQKTPSIVSSKILRIISASDTCRIQSVTRTGDEKESDASTASQDTPGPVLDYIPHVFDKYATSPALAADGKSLKLVLLTRSSVPLHGGSPSGLREKCLKYIRSSLDKLRREKGKDFSGLNVEPTFFDVSEADILDAIAQRLGNTKAEIPQSTTMGSWIRRLVCFVPIQIARAENNSLQPMNDGLHLSTTADFVDAISLANLVRFGLYEAAINEWTGPIKVISSMGKQSSGKSAACTSCWISKALEASKEASKKALEASIFNAAISNLTIFNKKDFHLDKETEAIFQRFQNGVSLVKADSKLFKGLFYMAIKDVDSSDVEDLKREFYSKIQQICSKSQDNFLTKMYGGSVEISAMPFFNRPEFHESIKDIAAVLEEITSSYSSGKSFLRDVKLILSQITTKDWSSIDSKRVALRISLLQEHLKSAVNMGCIQNDGWQPLISFDDQEQIADGPFVFDGEEFLVPDHQLELIPGKGCRDIDDVLQHVTERFREKFVRDGKDDEVWHLKLEKFISALVERRKTRVMDWLHQNTVDFSTGGDFQKLKLEGLSLMSEVERNLLLCSCVAELCNMHCKAQGRGHVHLLPCLGGIDNQPACLKIFDGCRHETCQYGPDVDVPKDELTHTAFWEHLRFEDPCSAEERKEFDLCAHRCKSDEHDPPAGFATSAATIAQHASFCTEPLWHDTVARGDTRFPTGYITDDGHHFNCDHTKDVSSNVIFIIDRSGSMQQQDIRPTMTKFSGDRLGCVYEAITRFIRTRHMTIQEDVVSVVLFNGQAQTAVQLETLREDIVDKLLGYSADGCTTYSSGLSEAEKILKISAQDAVLSSKCPTIVFLSDGGNNGGTDPLYHIRQMKALDPRLRVHTIMFGTDPDYKILQDMASAGDGSYECSLDEVQLSRRFEGLAKSLKTQVASLM